MKYKKAILELLKVIPEVDSWVIVFESTLEDTPPPVRYLTVKVVLLGATP